MMSNASEFAFSFFFYFVPCAFHCVLALPSPPNKAHLMTFFFCFKFLGSF